MSQTTFRVLITRTPTAASEFRHELASGAQALGREADLLYAPIRQAELLEASFHSPTLLACAGQTYRWVTFTSTNGVYALERFARWQAQTAQPGESSKPPGNTLAGLLAGLLAGKKIACVGKATRKALQDAGVRVDFMPDTQDAVHMLSQWPEQSAGLGQGQSHKILCVQGSNAKETLAQGLRQQGWQVVAENVYRMSSYPAAQPLVPDSALDGQSLILQQAVAQLSTVHALVATAPSLLIELFEAYCADPVARSSSFPPVIAIGASTGAAAKKLGLFVLISDSPQPADLARAVLRLNR